MADPFTIGAIVVGTGVQVFSDIAGGNARADEARKQAALDEQQADEILRRSKVTQQFMHEEKNQALGNTVSGFAKAGVDLSGSALLVLEDQNYQMQKQADEQLKEDQFNAAQVRRGAKNLRDQAGTYSTLGILQAGADIAGGVTKYFAATDRNSKDYTPTRRSKI